jgi:hypothetical protein
MASSTVVWYPARWSFFGFEQCPRGEARTYLSRVPGPQVLTNALARRFVSSARATIGILMFNDSDGVYLLLSEVRRVLFSALQSWARSFFH